MDNQSSHRTPRALRGSRGSHSHSRWTSQEQVRASSLGAMFSSVRSTAFRSRNSASGITVASHLWWLIVAMVRVSVITQRDPDVVEWAHLGSASNSPPGQHFRPLYTSALTFCVCVNADKKGVRIADSVSVLTKNPTSHRWNLSLNCREDLSEPPGHLLNR